MVVFVNGCFSYLFFGGWGRGHSLTKSSKHFSADRAIYTQLSALAVTNKICHFTKTFMTRKAMELSSTFFFPATKNPNRLYTTQPHGSYLPSTTDPVLTCSSSGGEICEVQLRVQVWGSSGTWGEVTSKAAQI